MKNADQDRDHSATTPHIVDRARKTIDTLTSLLKRVETGQGNDHLAIGKLAEHTARFDEAIEEYQQASGSDSDYREARARLAIALLKSGRKTEGLRVALDLYAQDPEFRFETLALREPTSICTVLGDAQRANGMLTEAIASYKQGISLQKGDNHAAAMGARLALERKDPEAAIQFGKALSDPDSFPALRAQLNALTREPALLPTVLGVARSSSEGSHV